MRKIKNFIFTSANDVEVKLTIKRDKQNNCYELYTAIILLVGEKETYLMDVKKFSQGWGVWSPNLDNFESDYKDRYFKTLTELLNYVGVTEIENKYYFQA